MIRVLISSHAYVVGINQEKLEALAKNKELKLSLLTVKSWRAALRDISLEKTSDKNYSIFSDSVWGKGKNDRFLYNPLYLYKVFRQVKPNLVHVEEEPWSLACLELCLLAKLFGARVIFFTWENLDRGLAIWYRFFRYVCLKLADGAIAGNSEAGKILEKKGFDKKTWILPQFGVNPNTFPLRKTKNKTFTVGFFGRLEEQKGIRTLLRAFDSLDDTIKLLVVGAGPLETLINQKNDKRINFVGPVTHSEVPHHLTRVDVLVLPSETTNVWKEQFGHVIIEAFSVGIPVIGSSSGAIPEVVGEAGLVFKEGDAVDLAEKIALLYKDKSLYDRLCEKAIERVKKNYTQEIIASQTFGIYQGLLKI